MKMYGVLFLDLQEEIVKNSHTVTTARLSAAAGALAKLAALHHLSVFASAVPPGGAFLSSVTDELPKLAPRNRTSTTAFADADLVTAIRAAEVETLVLSGVASEIVVQRTALDALAAGFQVFLAMDAIGGVSPRTEDAVIGRCVAAGAVTTSVISLAAELTEDFTTAEGGASLSIAYAAIAASAL